MTDKQIIIKRIRDCDNCKFRPETSKVCSDYENCYMVSEYICNLRKQLETKEQECEELRQYHNKCCEEFEKEKKEWLEKYNQVSSDFYSGKYCNTEKCQQLDQLKAENEGLKILHNSDKGLITTGGKLNYKLIQEVDKLKVENENWEKEYWKLNQGNDFLAEKNSRLMGCLTEIKEIAEHCMKQDICTTCDNSEKCHIEDEEIPTYDVCKLILQKISECEVG